MYTTTVQMNVRIPPTLLEWLKQSAHADHRSLNSFVVSTFEKLKQHEGSCLTEQKETEGDDQ